MPATRGAPAAVLTFEPHPRSVFMPDGEPFRLTPFRVKEREIARLGVDLLFVQHFDRAFAQKSAESFVDEVMVGAIGVTHIVVGHDCTFGNRRRGTPEMLREAGAAARVWRHRGRAGARRRRGGLFLDPYPRVAEGRQAARGGGAARPVLGDRRPRHGSATGAAARSAFRPPISGSASICARPSASMRCACPATAPTTRSTAATIDGVANIGLRPTVGGLVPRLEAHLFDIDVDLYGRHLRVSLVDFIRPEQKFAGLDALKAQIARMPNGARLLAAA